MDPHPSKSPPATQHAPKPGAPTGGPRTETDQPRTGRTGQTPGPGSTEEREEGGSNDARRVTPTT